MIFGDDRLPPRFWVKIEIQGECWIWTASLDDSGYAKFSVGSCRWDRGHRVAYRALVGEIPDGKEFDHFKCQRRNCVNPAHVEPVLHIENVRRGQLGETTRRRHLSRTHCPQGHPYSGANLYVVPSNGKRKCRACMYASNRRQHEKKRISNAA